MNTTLRKILTFVQLTILFGLITGCNYYRVTTIKPANEEAITKLQSQDKFFILHGSDTVWHISDIALNRDSLTGSISSLVGHHYYLTTNPKAINRFSKRDKNSGDNTKMNEMDVVNEVHLYANSYHQLSRNRVSIAWNEIERAEIYYYDKATSVGTIVVPSVMVGVGLFAAFVIIAEGSTTSSSSSGGSCPYIHAYNGSEYVLEGEIYSGSIRSALERDDYLNLTMIDAKNREYKLKLRNEAKEVQYNNLAEMIVIDHTNGVKVIPDKYGTFHTCKEVQRPITAFNNQGFNILGWVADLDNAAYCSSDFGGTSPNEEIVMTFHKPAGAAKAKLEVRAKNNIWLDFLFAEYFKLFGDQYDNFMQIKESESRNKQLEWGLEQNIPLSVYIEKEGKWEFVDYYNIMGPLAFRDDIMSLNLDGITADSFRIKLCYGFLFWDVDFAGIDFSPDEMLRPITVPLLHAVNENGIEITDQLSRTDNSYYVQDKTGNEALLRFTEPESTNQERTVFLHTRGYYHIVRDQNGKPDWKVLRSFMQPGRFPEFSLETYHQLLAKLNQQQH